ncbi:hypothetical protein ACFCYX_38685 [Streptomyces populi]|nr:hypothetical protein [Streptomyces populi]
MTSTHPRRRPQRRSDVPRGLQQIRGTLPPASAPRPVGEEVPRSCRRW